MKEDSLKKRYTIKLLANILTGVIGAILIAIVPKALGPIAYGQFIYLQDFFIKIVGFLDMGSSTAFFTKLSAKQTRKELITFYTLYAIFIGCFISLGIFIMNITGYLPVILPNIPEGLVYLGFLFAFTTWIIQIFIKISDAYALTVSVELIKIIHKIISLLLLLYFIYQLSFDLEKYFYFHYISIFSFLLILIILFIKKGIFEFKMLKLDFNFFKLLFEFIEYCQPLVVYSLLTVLVSIFDIWLLQIISGSEQMAFYGLAYSLAAMCFLFTSAMTPIIMREFSKSYEQKDLLKMKELFSRYIPMLYSISAYFAIFISFQSENVLNIFTNEKFEGAYLVLVIMALYPIHQTYGQLSGSVFYATGKTKIMRNIALFTQPFGLVVSLIFIYYFDLGAAGLAYKMLIMQFIGVSIQLYFNSKFLKLDIKYFCLHQIYSIVFFSILAYCSSLIIFFESSLLNFIISGSIYTFFVMICGYIFPQIFSITRDEINSLVMKLSKKKAEH